MAFLTELCNKLTSDKDKFDILYDSENLFVAWGNKGDDLNLLKFVGSIDREHYDWCGKLRGKNKYTAKMANEDNDHDYCQGYIYNVKNEQLAEFEKAALMPAMKYGYRLEKYEI